MDKLEKRYEELLKRVEDLEKEIARQKDWARNVAKFADSEARLLVDVRRVAKDMEKAKKNDEAGIL